MEEQEPRQHIQERLNRLEEKLTALTKEIQQLRSEFSNAEKPSVTAQPVATQQSVSANKPVWPVQAEKKIPPSQTVTTHAPKPKSNFNLESFIGKNLLSLVGIAITVIGIGIGVKYAIDNELINPLTRIVLGYVCGICLAGIAFKLQEKYKLFSAILLSGAMASLYFVTFAAYAYYALIPQLMAFTLMVVFTAFTVFASMRYNMQVIAHIALVGAYAVPFLLSDGSGRIVILLSYVSIVNAGILVIGFLRNWSLLNLTASLLTWVILTAWYNTSYISDEHLPVMVGFGTLFFGLFYVSVLANKFRENHPVLLIDMLVIALNAFFYFGLSMSALDNTLGNTWNGLFCVGNALAHFVATVLIYKKQLADKKLFYLTAALVLTFLTIAIPVQLDGNWVTIAWMAEAVVLLYIARKQQLLYYEILSYAVSFIALISLLIDWIDFYKDSYYYGYDEEGPSVPSAFLNVQFLASVVVCSLWFLLAFVNRKWTVAEKLKSLQQVMNYVFTCLFLLLTYYAVYYEIDLYWKEKFVLSGEVTDGYRSYDYTYNNIGSIWQYTFALFYFSLLSFINLYRFKHKVASLILFSLNMLCIFSFLTDGLYTLSNLVYDFTNTDSAHYGNYGILLVRYSSLLGAAILLFCIHKTAPLAFAEFYQKRKAYFNLLIHFIVLCLLSSELKTIMKLSTGTYPLTVSLLWGMYAMYIVVRGLKSRIKEYRMGGFILFFVALCKILLYDIQVSSTIGKTIVFITLGILLLLTSFLYQKLNKTLDKDAHP